MKPFLKILFVGITSFYWTLVDGSAASSISLTAETMPSPMSIQNSLTTEPKTISVSDLSQLKTKVSGQGIYFKGMTEPIKQKKANWKESRKFNYSFPSGIKSGDFGTTKTHMAYGIETEQHTLSIPDIPYSAMEDFKNGFLCGTGGVGDVPSPGDNFETEDCSASAIAQAVGFDLSKGDTLQFFNNFTYWLRQKGEREQNLKINNPDLKGMALDHRMTAEGWDTIGACCILLSTNPILQKVIAPEIQAQENEVKVIAQLWYNGNNMLQLWSQDIVLVPKGKGFIVHISNQEDHSVYFKEDSKEVAVIEKPVVKKVKTGKKGKKGKDKDKDIAQVVDKGVDTYLATVRKSMQPNNRNKEAYEQGYNSPRMIRVAIEN